MIKADYTIKLTTSWYK